MDLQDLHLDAIDFKEPPTKTQVVNALNNIHLFIAKMGASLLLDSNPIVKLGENSIGLLFNAAIQVRGAADGFDQSPNSAGLSLPQPGPVPMPRR